MSRNKVALKLRIKMADGTRRYASPVFAANNRLKPLYALVNGRAELHPEGVYNLRYRRGNRRVWEPIGNDPSLALVAKLKREKTIEALGLGIEVNEQVSIASRVKLADAVTEYLADTHAQKARKTFSGRKANLNHFLLVCEKTFIDEIDRRDLLDFMNSLREKNLADRTVFNRLGGLCGFLRAYGVSGLLGRNDWPRYTEKTVESYETAELHLFFATATLEDRLAFQFFLGSGGREQEVTFATWRDVNFHSKTFKVSAKPELGFKPKDNEERTVPLPDALVRDLKDRRLKQPEALLIFVNGRGGPEGHFLRRLKKLALRAGLNCGTCLNRNGLSCKKYPVCKHWELHKFRKTFATMHHESGVSNHP